MTAAKKKSRGGSRVTGMLLSPARTVVGVAFRWKTYGRAGRPIPYACGYWTDPVTRKQRQNSASLEANSMAAAVKHAMAPRRAAGMPCASVRAAVLAGTEFLNKGPK